MTGGESVDRQGYVVGFAVNPGSDTVLLVRKNRPTWQAGLLNGIGGHIEPDDESSAHAMHREFREETGLTGLPWEHMLRMTFPGAFIDFYRAHVPIAVLLDAETTTDEEVVLRDLSPLLAAASPERVIPNLRWLLPLAAYTADTYRPFRLTASVAEAPPEAVAGGWA